MPGPQIDADELMERLGYHPATRETAQLHDSLRQETLALASAYVRTVPQGRELSLAITHLEEALMWANKAIARMSPVDHLTPDIARVLPE